MALALYRKYRPRTFAEVIGQEHVTEPLSQALRSGRLHHAYLFSGPRGCGKTSSARILARSLNCERGPTPEPCGVCESCRSLAPDGSGSIDVIEIDAASHGGVDDARELRERAFFAPASSRFKIYVIDEAHMVSTQGFNALLKLVEEPPDYVKFIFATTEPDKVLGTIKSRTHHYPFRLIPPGILRPYLEQLADAENVKVEQAVFPLVVRAGGGSARDSLSVLDQLIAGAGPEGVSYTRAVALLGVTDAALIDEMCDALAAGDGAAAYATIDRVAEAGHDPRRFASDLLERLRDLIVMQQVPEAAAKGLIDGPADQLERMSAQTQRLGPATLSRCADIVHNGLVEMRGTTAPRLLLELITARMLLPTADKAESSLLQRLERMEHRLANAGDQGFAAGEPDDDYSGPAVLAGRTRPPGGGAAPGGSTGAASAGPAGSASAGPAGSASAGPAGSASAGPAGSASAGPAGSASAGPAGSASVRDGGSAGSASGGVGGSAGSTSISENGLASPGAGGPAGSTPAGGAGAAAARAAAAAAASRAGGARRTGIVPDDDAGESAPSDDPPPASQDLDTRSPAVPVPPSPTAYDPGATAEDPVAATANGDGQQPRRVPPQAVMADPATPDPVIPAAAAPGELDAAAVRRVWDEIVTMIRISNKKIAALASEATVRDIDGDTLVLTFRHSFHARTLAENPEAVSDAAYEVLGGRWQIRCELAGDERGGAGPAPTRPSAGRDPGGSSSAGRPPGRESGGSSSPAGGRAPGQDRGARERSPGSRGESGASGDRSSDDDHPAAAAAAPATGHDTAAADRGGHGPVPASAPDASGSTDGRPAPGAGPVGDAVGSAHGGPAPAASADGRRDAGTGIAGDRSGGSGHFGGGAAGDVSRRAGFLSDAVGSAGGEFGGGAAGDASRGAGFASGASGPAVGSAGGEFGGGAAGDVSRGAGFASGASGPAVGSAGGEFGGGTAGDGSRGAGFAPGASALPAVGSQRGDLRDRAAEEVSRVADPPRGGPSGGHDRPTGAAGPQSADHRSAGSDRAPAPAAAPPDEAAELRGAERRLPADDVARREDPRRAYSARREPETATERGQSVARAAPAPAPADEEEDWPETALPGGLPTGPSDDDWPEPVQPAFSAETSRPDAPAPAAVAFAASAVAAGVATATPLPTQPPTRSAPTNSAAAPTRPAPTSAGAPTRAAPANGGAPTRPAPASGGAAAAARAAARAAAAGRAKAAPVATPQADADWAGEPPFDPEYDTPGKVRYEGFDPGDEPTDEVIDEKAARVSSEQQAFALLHEALGAERIGEIDLK